MEVNSLYFFAVESSADEVMSAISDLVPVAFESIEKAPVRLYTPRDHLTAVHIDVSEMFIGDPIKFALEDLPMLTGGVARCVNARAWCALVVWEKPLEAVVTAFDAGGGSSWEDKRGTSALARLGKELGLEAVDVKRRTLSKKLGEPSDGQMGEGATMQVMRGPMTIIPMREDGAIDLTQKELEGLMRRSKEAAAINAAALSLVEKARQRIRGKGAASADEKAAARSKKPSTRNSRPKKNSAKTKTAAGRNSRKKKAVAPRSR